MLYVSLVSVRNKEMFHTFPHTRKQARGRRRRREEEEEEESPCFETK
jgi:hypothetical protein